LLYKTTQDGSGREVEEIRREKKRESETEARLECEKGEQEKYSNCAYIK